MKAIITGHTRGIGLALYNYFLNQNYDVIGASRSNGYNISIPLDREKILHLAKDADVFVNNAYSNDGSQFSLLKKIHQLWKGTNKKIINISTRYTNGKDIYCIHKKYIDDFCAEQVYNKPFILNVKPGLTDTDRVKNINNAKMDTDQLVDIIDWALKQNLLIHSICFAKST